MLYTKLRKTTSNCYVYIRTAHNQLSIYPFVKVCSPVTLFICIMSYCLLWLWGRSSSSISLKTYHCCNDVDLPGTPFIPSPGLPMSTNNFTEAMCRVHIGKDTDSSKMRQKTGYLSITNRRICFLEW